MSELTAEISDTRSGPPVWLNASFVETALRHGGYPNACVRSIDVQYAVKAGDNYLSRVFRIKASVLESSQLISIIVKCLPDDEMLLDMVNKSEVFSTESRIFVDVLFRLEKYLKDVFGNSHIPLAAKCLHIPSKDVIVLEDLAPQGFVMKDRIAGLDLDHATVVMRALGRMHAASIVLLENEPESVSSFKSMFTSDPDPRDQTPKFIRNMGILAKSWKEIPEKVSQDLFAIADVAVARRFELVSHCEELKVLVHGDMWTNNFMFRGEGPELQMRFVDFQLCFVGSPAIDLINFQVTSVPEEGFRENWPRLLSEYCSSLEETARRLGVYPVPCAADVERSMTRWSLWTVVGAFMWLPAVLAEGRYDFDSVQESNASAGDSSQGIKSGGTPEPAKGSETVKVSQTATGSTVDSDTVQSHQDSETSEVAQAAAAFSERCLQRLRFLLLYYSETGLFDGLEY